MVQTEEVKNTNFIYIPLFNNTNLVKLLAKNVNSYK